MKQLRPSSRDKRRAWLLCVVIGFGVTIFAYTAVQQSLRLGLNDPQWRIAEDTADRLASGATPAAVIPTNVIDESRSLSPFVTIVDDKLHVLASSGRIGSTIPLPPASSFPAAQARGHNWFTWQHNNNRLRDAAVIMPYHGRQSGYVLVARSMSQVENTISHITVLAGLTLLGILLAATFIVLIV